MATDTVEQSETDHSTLNPALVLDALWVAVGVLLLWAGREVYPPADLIDLSVTTLLFCSGIAIVFLATTGWLRNRSQSQVGYATLLPIGGLGGWHYLQPSPNFYASDGALFESLAANRLIAGENPMRLDMTAELSSWPLHADSAALTATISGDTVATYSYPGGSLLFSTLEAALLPTQRLGILTLLASMALAAYLVYRVRPELVVLVPLIWLIPTLRPHSAAMGMLSPFWLLPLAIGLAAWYDHRFKTAAIATGAACAVKQLAWPVAGLMLLHTLRTEGREQAASSAAYALATAAAMIGWLIAWNPRAWLHSQFFSLLPSADPLVRQGIGLTSLSLSGVITIPRAAHGLLVLGMVALLIAATWHRPKTMQYAIPFATIAILILHYRTLPSYYSATLPLGLIALDARAREATR